MMLVVAAASSATRGLVTVAFTCFLLIIIIIFFVGVLFQWFFGPRDLTLSLPVYMPDPCPYASVVVGCVRCSLFEHHKRS